MFYNLLQIERTLLCFARLEVQEMTITRELLKTEIANVAEQDLEILHRIVQALSRTHDSSSTQPAPTGWRTFVEQTYGILADDPIFREPQGDYERV